jgi:8-oxo-dGTP pyrophosphatase MutT (NUDIX family)
VSDADEPIRAGGVVLMTREDPMEVLLMRHTNRWDFPKGHCEDGESFRDAALREMEEETGVDSSEVALDPDFVFDLRYPVRSKRSGGQLRTKQVRFFLGYIQRRRSLTVTEHEGYQWLRWRPPHRIQERTIDPVLAAVGEHLGQLDSPSA